MATVDVKRLEGWLKSLQGRSETTVDQRSRRCTPQFLIVCVADPANLSLDVDGSQRAEATGARVDAQVTGEVLPVGSRWGVEDGVGVERTVHPEVQVCHAAVAGRCQDLGQHRHHAILVLRQPRVPGTSGDSWLHRRNKSHVSKTQICRAYNRQSL